MVFQARLLSIRLRSAVAVERFWIVLDHVCLGPLLPCGRACQLTTSCLTNMPHFGESQRVLNLSGQCISSVQVSQLFSEEHSPFLPTLKSASFRLIASDLTLSTRNAVVPPEIQPLQLTMGILSIQFTKQMF